MSVDFTVSLLRENNKERSVVFSPFTLGTSLATIHFGSNGRTQMELNEILYRGRSTKQTTQFYSDLFYETHAENPNIKSKMINKLLLRKGFVIDPIWSAEVRNLFGTEVENCNFKEAGEAAKSLNAECREKMNGKISQVISPSNFTTQIDLKAILVNASSFKGLWRYSYYAPKFGDFFGLAGPRTEKFLQRSGNDFLVNFNNDDVHVVAIPYKDYAYKLWLFLPAEELSLQMWIDGLDSNLLSDLMYGAKRERCYVKFPRFRCESYIPAKRTLLNIGLRQIFSDRASLYKISDSNPVITDVVHKTYIEVDEEGAEPKIVHHRKHSASKTVTIHVDSSSGPVSTSSTATQTVPQPTIQSTTQNVKPQQQQTPPAAHKASKPTLVPKNKPKPKMTPFPVPAPPMPLFVPSAQPQYQPPPYLQFEANRPFLYMVTFNRKILFCGTYY